MSYIADMLADFKRAEREAERLVTKYYEQPPIDPEAIAEAEGIRVVYARFNRQMSAQVAGFSDPNNSRIVVNQDLPFNRKTYTIAHELGHHVLHQDYLSDDGKYQIFPRMNSYDGPKPSEEQEADAFAANLLVPLKMLRSYVDFASVRELAQMFMVSQDVILYRMKRL